MVPMMGSNPPGFFQMPEMSCGSKGCGFAGDACGAGVCALFCEKNIGVKAEAAMRANKTVRGCVMWRLPSYKALIRGSYCSCSDSGRLRSSGGILTSTAL